MAKKREQSEGGDVVSIVGPGMVVEGDCSSEGTIRVEGRVEGNVHTKKAVVVSEDGVVVGDIETQDAVVAGRVRGSILAKSRLELQASCRVEGDIGGRRVKLEEGGQVDGRISMGDGKLERDRSPQGGGPTREGAGRPA